MTPGSFGTLDNAGLVLAWIQDVASWRGFASGRTLELLCGNEANTLLWTFERDGALVRGRCMPEPKQQLGCNEKVTEADAPRSWFMWLPGPRLHAVIDEMVKEIARREALPIVPIGSKWRTA